MAIRERMLFLLSSQREQRKNVSIFHSSPPALSHQCVDFLLSQKLLNLLLDLSTNKNPNLIISGQTYVLAKVEPNKTALAAFSFLLFFSFVSYYEVIFVDLEDDTHI